MRAGGAGRADNYTDPVDGRPYLIEIGRHLRDVTLEAVLIGNAAAALQGAPVTTVDFDFMFRKTPRNLRKLKAFAKGLGAMVLRPYYPAAELYRVVRDDGLQVDFMAAIHGVRSFEGLRDRATTVDLDDVSIRVASLGDIIKSKKAARRPRDLAALPVLEKAHEQAKAANSSKAGAGRARKRK
jgi:predicted nucleotidyltransferase